MKKSLVVLAVTFTILCVLSMSVFIVKSEGSHDNKFRKAERSIPNQYVVMFKPNVHGKDVDKFAKRLAKDNNGKIQGVYEFIKAFGVQMSEKDAIKLSKDEDVLFVEENGLVSITQSSCPNSSAFAPGAYGVDRLDQRYLPRDGSYCPTRTGRGVNVFVLDTGIWPTHDDFKNSDGTSRARVFADVTGGNGLDCNNHGTFVASTVGGNVFGVAKEANTYGIKVTTGCTGDATFQHMADGINKVIASGLPQRVINISFGEPVSSTIDNAVRNAINNYGIPVIAAAGNSGIDASNSSPARVAEAITVAASEMSDPNYGATNVTERRALFPSFPAQPGSNYGSVVDLFAPGGFTGGSNIAAAKAGTTSEYDGYSGTSAAAPHVAGIAAMYLEAHPGALPPEVQQAIVANATTGVLLLDPNEGSPNRMAYTNFLSPPGATVQFSSSSYSVTEGTPSVTLTVTRTGSTANAASVDYFTDYDPNVQCNDTAGNATQRCDLIGAFGTIKFATGESSKTFSVLINDDGFVEPTETARIELTMPSGVDLGSQFRTQLTITDNDSSNTNPVDNTQFFVRQQYADFLNREPDPPGFAAWVDTINNCTGDTTQCDRVHVSQSFYQSAEFQQRGSIIFRFYAATLGRHAGYVEFFRDLSRTSGFLTDAELEANKVKLFEGYAQRPEFAATYNQYDSAGYVDALASMAGVTLSNRDQLISDLNTGQKNRAQVLRDVVEFNSAVQQKFYNEAFVVMEYYGYLRREPDGFWVDWLNYLNSTGDFRGMVNGFANSTEYRSRFGP